MNPGSRFRAGWATRRADGKGVDGDAPAHPNVDLADGLLVIRAADPAGKAWIDAREGWIAYVRGDLLLVKSFPVDPAGRYSDHGATLAPFFSAGVAELEPISPHVELAPGQRYEFPETWRLARLAAPVATAAAARALAPRIRALHRGD